MHQRRGLLLIDMLVAFALLYLAGIVTLNLLRNLDQSYARAAHMQVALGFAKEELELIRGRHLPRTPGVQTLPALQARIGNAPMSFRRQLSVSTQGNGLLVTSLVRWRSANQDHSLELSSYLAP